MRQDNALYTLENNIVFSLLLNLGNDNENSREGTGSEFHKTGPVTVKLRSPYLFILVLWTVNSPCAIERAMV